MRITTDELLDVLRDALEKPEGQDGETVSEMVERTGMSEEYIRRGLKTLLSRGEWEVLRVRRNDISGRSTLVPAYRKKP